MDGLTGQKGVTWGGLGIVLQYQVLSLSYLVCKLPQFLVNPKALTSDTHMSERWAWAWDGLVTALTVIVISGRSRKQGQ